MSETEHRSHLTASPTSSLFQIINAESGNCLDVSKSKILRCTFCNGRGDIQLFAYTKQHQIMSNEYCLGAADSFGQVKLVRCTGMKGDQEWNYDVDVS